MTSYSKLTDNLQFYYYVLVTLIANEDYYDDAEVGTDYVKMMAMTKSMNGDKMMSDVELLLKNKI